MEVLAAVFKGDAVLCLVTQSCLSLCDPTDCSPPGSSVHGILQARIVKCVAMPSSRGSSPPRDWTPLLLCTEHICWRNIMSSFLPYVASQSDGPRAVMIASIEGCVGAGKWVLTGPLQATLWWPQVAQTWRSGVAVLSITDLGMLWNPHGGSLSCLGYYVV